MSVVRYLPGGGAETHGELGPVVDGLRARQPWLADAPVDSLLALFDDFAGRLTRDPRTQGLEGTMFLAAWLRRNNLEDLLRLNLQGNAAYLDGFQPRGHNYLAAKPHGLVAMWMAGNVATLPMFSLVPGLLTKNVCLVKLAQPEPEGIDRLLAVLAESAAEGLRGEELLQAAAVVWFDYQEPGLSEAMSRAADAKVIWGGSSAIEAITRLPRPEHCTEIVFGPKYSIGLIDRKRLEGDERVLDEAIAGFVRDVAIFDQRACSAPQTIFVERNARWSLRQIGERFARHLERLGPKPGCDPYTTVRILEARARWAMDESRDVIASADGANWTVCLDRDASLKEAVQSRTLFLTEVGTWREVIPLLTPKVQTVGIAMAEREDALALAEAATGAGAVRCVRPGLMNNYESPWDGKLLVGQLVRWVTLKP
jgi:hypothetical protein